MCDLSSPRSFTLNPPVQLEQLELEQTNSTNLHIVQIESSNIEQGLHHLLSKVQFTGLGEWFQLSRVH